jgi:hypothetical protein
MLLFGTAAAVLLGIALALPPDGLFSADSGSKYWQTLAFAEVDGRPVTLDYPAVDLDPRCRRIPPFTVAVDGELASIYPVLFPILSAAPVAVLGDRGVRLVPWLAAVAAAWAAGLLATSHGGRKVTARVAALVLAATPLPFYAVTFWEHSLAVLAVVAGLLAVAGDGAGGPGGRWRWAVLGVLLGAGSWIRTEVGFLAPILLLALVVPSSGGRLARAMAGTAGFAAGAGLGGLIQFLALGRWLPIHVAYHADGSIAAGQILVSRLVSVRNFLAPDWSTAVAVAVWLVALVVALSPHIGRGRLGLALSGAAVACALAAAAVVPAARWLRGARPTEAFPTGTPAAVWLVLSALPLVLWGSGDLRLRLRRWALPLAAALWLPAAVFIAWPVRSFEWGGRLFLPTVVILVSLMGSLPISSGPGRRVRRAVVAGTVAAAVIVQVLGLVLAHHGAVTHRGIAAEVAAFVDPGEAVITDAYMVPLVAGRGWFEARYLYCTRQRDLPRLLARIGAGGAERWTYATVLRAPGPRLGVDERLVDRAGGRWLLVDHLERSVRSQTVRLLRFRKVAGASSQS